ncbi:hypothetical protein FE257_005383 [Aspergillus nanangensis]|uniref:Uncharacterized protein n=1 Tax=Aspergillus nanangensis TaxID=2582783 RepID=A0AAD4CQX4_ASPNN|nr:hypothetical protein FE257_005383 [Aspergillus nanangensis]
MILTALSVLARLGAVASAIIVLGLNGKFLQNAAWNSTLLIYVEVIAALTVVAALIPPYPNFLYDLVAGLAWVLSAIFAIIIQFFESDCYGFRDNPDINCATYKANTAFAFLGALAWLASAAFGVLRILAVILNIQRHPSDRPTYVGANFTAAEKGKAVQREEEGENLSPDDKKRVKGAGNSHIARYFLCYGLLGVVLLAVALPLLIIYAAPAFGQYLLQRVPIPAVNITLLNPGNDTIQFSVFSKVQVPDTLKIGLEPMNVSFFLEDTAPDIIPFASVELPRLSFGSKERIIIENQELKLRDLEQFARLAERVAYYPTFRVAGKGQAKVSIGAIKTWVNLYKAVELTGFNNFTGFDIQEFGIQRPDADGYNVYGKAIVDNPSPASVTLGNITLSLLIDDIILGEAIAEVNDIVPGNNTFNVKGKLNQANVEKNITDILRAEIPYLRNDLVMASASGKSVVYQGRHLPYWEKAFESIRITATRPVRPLLDSVVDSGVSMIIDQPAITGVLKEIVDPLVDSILSRIKTLPSEDVDDYTEALGGIGTIALKLISTLGFI